MPELAIVLPTLVTLVNTSSSNPVNVSAESVPLANIISRVVFFVDGVLTKETSLEIMLARGTDSVLILEIMLARGTNSV